MSKLSSVLASVTLLVLAGCSSSGETKATADVCSHCAGTQMVTAKGECEACGMKVDVCTACPGAQTLTADGKCSGCGGKIAVKS